MNPTQHLLLLPGMMCDSRLWQAQTEYLAPHCESISIGDLSQTDSIESIATSVLEKAPKRFALAGLSMGGIVAFELWRQAPERISRLALLDTNAEAETSERRIKREELLGRVLDGELQDVMIDSLKPHYLAAANRDNQDLLDTIVTMALDLGKEVYSRQSNAIANRQCSLSTLQHITVPTLVICGKEDTLCPVDYHETMVSAIPDARLQVLEHCGHLAPMEQAQRVNDELLSWLVAA